MDRLGHLRREFDQLHEELVCRCHLSAAAREQAQVLCGAIARLLGRSQALIEESQRTITRCGSSGLTWTATMRDKPSEIRTQDLDASAWQALLDSFRWGELLESIGSDPQDWNQMTPDQRGRAVALAIELRNLHRRDPL